MNFNDKVVYQIYPKSFNDTTGNGYGDIQGIIDKLDYISKLGVDYIWLSPICLSPQNDNGYDIADYYEIDPLFGTKVDYCKLIEQANKRGMKVMLDLVLNHTSSEHEWFKRALAGEKKYQDYYIWRDEPNELESYFLTSAWTYAKEVGKYYLHFFDHTQPDLNWSNPQVRAEIYKMVNYWIDLGVEGFRLDVIDLIGKEPDKLISTKGPKFYEYLRELNAKTFKDKILTVGECWNSSLEDSRKMCSSGLSEIFHFNHLTISSGSDKWEQKDMDFTHLVEVIKEWQNEYDGNQTIVMNNHDLPRLLSHWLNDNECRVKSAKNLATIFTLLNGTQYIYQGEEYGATNAYFDDITKYNDVETLNKYNSLIKSGLTENEAIKRIMPISRDNARTPMAWNQTKYGGFSINKPWLSCQRDYRKINVTNDLYSDESIYRFYKELIKFKKINYNKYINHKLDEIKYENGILSYAKAGMTVTANMTNQAIEYEVSDEVIFNNYSRTFENKLAPYQAIVTLKK